MLSSMVREGGIVISNAKDSLVWSGKNFDFQKKNVGMLFEQKKLNTILRYRLKLHELKKIKYLWPKPKCHS